MPLPGGNPGNIAAVLGNWPGEQDINPDPAGTVGASAMNMRGNRMPLVLPAQPQSWGLQNPTLPTQLDTWLRNYYGGVGQLDPNVLGALVEQARAGFTWDTAHAGIGHGNDGLPDGGANLPSDGTLAGMGAGPRRFGGSSAGGITADLSEPQPTWLGTVDPTSLTHGGSGSIDYTEGTGQLANYLRDYANQAQFMALRGPAGYQRPPATADTYPNPIGDVSPQFQLTPLGTWGQQAMRNGP